MCVNGSRRWTVRVARRECELDAIAGAHRVDFISDSRDQSFQKGGCRCAAGLLEQLHEGETSAVFTSAMPV
jgi:hypothetical protein